MIRSTKAAQCGNLEYVGKLFKLRDEAGTTDATITSRALHDEVTRLWEVIHVLLGQENVMDLETFRQHACDLVLKAGLARIVDMEQSRRISLRRSRQTDSALIFWLCVQCEVQQRSKKSSQVVKAERHYQPEMTIELRSFVERVQAS